MYKKILLAVDGSENSLRAADEAIKIAALNSNPQIEIIYTIVPAKSAIELLHAPTKEENDLIIKQQIAPVEEKIKAKNIKYLVTILHGEAANSIIEHEKNGDFDLLVIGSRGLNAVQKFVLGSVSSKVIQRVDCPVLVVK